MKKRFIVSIDLGATNIKLALLDYKYKIIHRELLDTRSLGNFEKLIQAIVNSTKGLIQYHKLNKNDILGLGLGAPGPIDASKGLIHFLPNIPGCKDVNLAGILKQKLRLPVYIDNDANLFTLGEFSRGAGKGLKNIIGITLGTGVGGGIILDGQLYRGGKFAAGEIGHIPIVIKGRKCNCGGRGCIEAYIGNQRIESWAKREFNRSITLKELSNLAARNNQKAIRIWQMTGYLLGFALTGVVNLFNPDAIVIGGGIANAGKVLFSNIRRVIKNNAMSVQARHVKVIKSKLGNDAALIGAAILVKKRKGHPPD